MTQFPENEKSSTHHGLAALLLWGSLHTKALLETVDAAAGIHQLLLAGEEGVTLRADFHANILLPHTQRTMHFSYLGWIFSFIVFTSFALAIGFMGGCP